MEQKEMMDNCGLPLTNYGSAAHPRGFVSIDNPKSATRNPQCL
jgi:hypothetical protein